MKKQLILASLILCLPAAVFAASWTLFWTPSPDSDVVKYNVYTSTNTTITTNMNWRLVGSTAGTNFTTTNLASNVRIFGINAEADDGSQSDKSMRFIVRPPGNVSVTPLP